ncbi:hypothetical protein EBR77_01095, partial [bacterium]|nr:hypothetical protein [bacterium]
MKSFFIQIFTVFLFFNNGPTINAASKRTDSEQWQSDHNFERWKTTLSKERFGYIHGSDLTRGEWDTYRKKSKSNKAKDYRTWRLNIINIRTKREYEQYKLTVLKDTISGHSSSSSSSLSSSSTLVPQTTSYFDDIPEFAAFADRKDPIPTAPESVALQPAGSKRTLDEEDDDYDDYDDAQVAPTSSSSSSSSATGSRRGQADFTEKRYKEYLAKSRDDKPLTFEQWQKKLLAVRQRRELQKQKSVEQRSVKRRRKVKKGPSEHELMDALDEEPKYSDIDIEYVLSTAKTTNTPFHKALIL